MPLGFVVAPGAIASLAAVFGLDVALNAGLLLTIGIIASAIAIRAPIVTIVLAVVLGQLTGHEWRPLIPEPLRTPMAAGISLRHSDVVYFGIVVALGVRLLAGDATRAHQALRQQGFLMSLLCVLLFSALRGIGDYGVVHAFGEFRTYYQPLLLVPYVTLSLRTGDKQWGAFKVLAAIALLLMPLSILRGGIVSEFALFGSGAGHGDRWFTAAGGLTMLAGVTGFAVAHQLRRIKFGGLRTMVVVTLFIALALLNPHRSVWLASVVAAISLVALGLVPVRRQAVSVLIAVLAAAAGFLSAPQFTSEAATTLGQRAAAFTSPESDPTSSWRLFLWSQALAQVREEPVLGIGLGRHFRLVDQAGHLISTSPHNFYITLLLHTGATGATLYVLFAIATSVIVLRASRSEGANERARSIMLTALVTFTAMSAFFLAYSSEFMHLTWAITGLGLSAAMSTSSRVERDGYRRPDWRVYR